MGALLCGLDISSKAIHACLIPLDPDDGSDAPPVTLRSFDLPVFKPASTTPAYRRVERCRVIHRAMRELLAPFNELDYRDGEVAHVCIEEPFGSVSRSTVLWEILGAILASIPPHIERDTITCQEWRRIVWPETGGSENWKYLARIAALQETGIDVNEHEAEAYLIARACRTRLEKAVSA